MPSTKRKSAATRTPLPKKAANAPVLPRRGNRKGVAAALAAAAPAPTEPIAQPAHESPAGVAPALTEPTAPLVHKSPAVAALAQAGPAAPLVHTSPEVADPRDVPAEQGDGVPTLPELLVSAIPQHIRAPFKNTVGDQHRLAVAVGHLAEMTAVQGPLLVMLSPDPKYPGKVYIDKEDVGYTQYVDVARQLPSNKMAKLYVTLLGVAESVAITRLADTLPTMRFRICEEDYPFVQALGEKCVAALRQVRHRLQHANRGPKNERKRLTTCKYASLLGNTDDVIWCNKIDSSAMYIYSVNPTNGKVRRLPEWFDSKPLDASYEGLPMKLLCEVTLRVAAPLSEQPTSKATVKLVFKPLQMILQGVDPRPTLNTTIDALGLEMDDDAPGSDDDMFLGFRARALSESAVARYALRPPPRACADAVSRAAWAWQARRPMLRRRSTSQATTRRTCRGATAGALLQCIRYVCQDSERGGSRVQPAPPQTACGRCTANKWPTP